MSVCCPSVCLRCPTLAGCQRFSQVQVYVARDHLNDPQTRRMVDYIEEEEEKEEEEQPCLTLPAQYTGFSVWT